MIIFFFFHDNRFIVDNRHSIFQVFKHARAYLKKKKLNENIKTEKKKKTQ